MPVPTAITDLSTTAASNGPAGSDLPSTVDDYLRAVQAIVKSEYDTQQTANATYSLATDLTTHGALTGTSAHGLGTISTQSAASVAITGGTITGITDLALADGGTGSSTAAGARTNLGLDSMATQAAGAVAITGGTVTGITDLAVADGGTGSSTAAGARTNLGLGTIATAAAPSGTVVGTTDTQTLTGKTIVVASNTITTAASGDLSATELNAALAELQAAITALEAATVNVQTGHVSATSLSTGTGEDTRYTDVTITAVSAVANCEVHFVGGASSVSVAVGSLVNDGSTTVYKCTARLTSTTNLRIATPSASGNIGGRWQVIDHGA